MAELRAPEQNRLLGQLARMLRATEGDIAAPEFLPKGLDVMGLVRQLMLPSAETVEKLSYGDPLFRMPTQSNIPITADREYLADVAGMIPFGAPAARPSARAVQDLVRQIQTEPPTGAIRPYNREEIKKIDEAILAAKVPENTYFHGTDKAFKDFRRKDRGLAYYFTPDPMQAASYSGMDVGANIRPVKLDIKKTYRGGDVDEIMEVVKKEEDYYPYTISKMREFVEQQDPHAFHTPSVVKALKKLGYDSFVEYEDGIEQIGVFSAKNVKPSFGGGLLDQPAQSVEKVYHGTSPKAAQQIEQSGFDITKSADGSVWFTSNPEIGEVAATSKGAVVERLVDLNDLKLGGWSETDKFSTDELIQQGYDGLRLVDNGQVTYQIFNPEKLKKPIK